MSWLLLTGDVPSQGTFLALGFKAFSFEEGEEVSYGSMFSVLQVVVEDCKINLKLVVFVFVFKNPSCLLVLASSPVPKREEFVAGSFQSHKKPALALWTHVSEALQAPAPRRRAVCSLAAVTQHASKDSFWAEFLLSASSLTYVGLTKIWALKAETT